MAELCLTTRQMVERVLEYAFATAYDDASGDQKAEALALLNAGLRRFIRGGYTDEQDGGAVHRWSFLEPVASLTTAAGDGDYDLPDDFGGLVEDPVYDYSGTGIGPDLARVSPETIRRAWRDDNTTAQPRLYAVEPKSFSQSTGQQWQLLLAPAADGAYGISDRYSVVIDALTDATDRYPPGGALQCDVIVQAAKAAAELTSGDVAGQQEELYQQMFLEAVARDATTMDEAEVEQLTDEDVGM